MTAAHLQALNLDGEISGKRKLPRYDNLKSCPIQFILRMPSHWRVEKLKHVASVRFSSVDKKSEDGEMPVRLCNYTDVYNRDVIFDDPDFMQATATEAEIKRFTLRKGDVLITKDSEEWNDIAVPAYVAENLPGVLCGYHLALIRPNQDEIDGSFLSRAFSAEGIREQFHIAANGITRFGLPNRAISGALFPIPPLNEQRAIAAFLKRETGRIDELIQKKQRLIALAEEARLSLITSAVTKGIAPGETRKPSGIEWLKAIPFGWSALPFRRVLSGIEQGWSPQADQRRTEGDEWAVLKVGAVLKGRFRPEEHKALPPDLEPERRFEVKEGDLLLTRGNTPELVADVCVVPVVRQRLMLSDLHYRLTLDESRLSKRFACYWLLSWAGRQQIEADAHGTSNSMVKVSQGDIRSWMVLMPPLDVQIQITDYLDHRLRLFDELAFRVTDGIARLRQYRFLLISTAVTGQIDVRQYRHNPEAMSEVTA